MTPVSVVSKVSENPMHGFQPVLDRFPILCKNAREERAGRLKWKITDLTDHTDQIPAPPRTRTPASLKKSPRIPFHPRNGGPPDAIAICPVSIGRVAVGTEIDAARSDAALMRLERVILSPAIDNPACYVTFNRRWIKRNEADMAQNSGKFVAYFRVSTGRQGKSGLGIEAQREAVKTYLNGGDWQIVGEFTEVESGKRSDRPALEQALAAARLHRASLVVSKVDRLTRSVAFLSRLLEAGVDVRFADLPQIEGATGRFLLQQMVAVAELEAGMISKRTKDALAQAKKRGVKLGGRRRKIVGKDAKGKPIYGDVAGGSPKARATAIRVRQERATQRAADIAPTIKALQAAGATSLRAIAAALNEQNIPTARGDGEWTATQVMRVLERLDPFVDDGAAA